MLLAAGKRGTKGGRHLAPAVLMAMAVLLAAGTPSPAADGDGSDAQSERIEALRLAVTAAKDATSCLKAAVRLSQLMEDVGDLSSAHEPIDQAIERFPELQSDPEAVLRLAYLYDRTGEHQKAVAACETLLSQATIDDQSRAAAQLRIAWAYGHQGDTQKAKDAFLAFMQEHPEKTRLVAIAKADLAYTALARLGEYDAAIRMTQEALADLGDYRPEAQTLTFRLGRCHEKLGKWAEALAYYEQLGPETPSDPSLDLGLCAFHSRGLVACSGWGRACLRRRLSTRFWPAATAGSTR